MDTLNTLKGDQTMSWFRHKPPKYPPNKTPPKNNEPTK